jgi:cell division protein FtsQ
VRAFWIVLAFVLVALVTTTRFWPTIERVDVVGHAHLTRTDVLRLANVAPGDPLLWVTRFSVRGLEAEPWVLQSRVTRHWPDVVSVWLLERQPVIRDGVRAWAADGTQLVGADPASLEGLPTVTGWGTPRIAESLELLGMLAGRGVRVITYGPEGFEVVLADVELFTPSVHALRTQWSAFESQRGSRVAVYPWGVSSAP